MADYVVDEGERDEGPNERHNDEREPLVQPNQPTYLRFRQGRQPQIAHGGWSVCTGLILRVFKVAFCSLGLWGHQKWNYIPRSLFVMIRITQASYQIAFDCRCPFFDCNNYNKTHHNKTHHDKTNDFLHTREMCFTIFSLAALLSYSIFLICFKIASTSQDSAMMSPSKSLMEDVIDRKEITLLFFAFIIIMASFLSGIVLLYISVFEGNDIQVYVIATTVVLTHWASFNTCHVFAISSFSLGRYLVKYLEGVKAYLITFILEENKL